MTKAKGNCHKWISQNDFLQNQILETKKTGRICSRYKLELKCVNGRETTHKSISQYRKFNSVLILTSSPLIALARAAPARANSIRICIMVCPKKMGKENGESPFSMLYVTSFIAEIFSLLRLSGGIVVHLFIL